MTEEIMDLMENIKYGYLDKFGNIHDNIDEEFSDNYILQSPKQLELNKYGVCWDQVELERYYFKQNDIKIRTFFLVYYDSNKYPTHTFLVFERDNHYYWFEHSWEKFKGIHEYKNLNELLVDVKCKFINNQLNNDYDKDNIRMYEYAKPKYNIDILDFYKHCENGKEIKI